MFRRLAAIAESYEEADRSLKRASRTPTPEPPEIRTPPVEVNLGIDDCLLFGDEEDENSNYLNIILPPPSDFEEDLIIEGGSEEERE